MSNVTLREKTVVMKSLGAGLVPRVGLHHLVVGRKRETEAVCRDLDSIKDGGGAFRLVVGPYSSGKTFFEQISKLTAIQNNLVVVHADLSVNHRLHGRDGKGRNLYAELMTNLSTKALPEGGGLRPFVESWISTVHHGVTVQGGTADSVAQEIAKLLRPLKDFVGGNEFAEVLAQYYRGYANMDPSLQDAAIRWLKAEYSTKTEAHEALGVRRIIGDEDLYPALRTFAAFTRIAGCKGSLVILDELATLTHRLPNAKSRQGSFEVLLTMLNDAYQGNCQGLGFLVAGTPECLTDPDRGLFSYPPLRARLQTYETHGLADYSGPVIKLEPLTAEALFVLLQNIRHVQAMGDESQWLLPDEALRVFLEKSHANLPTKAVANPRDVVRPFVSLLSILGENPSHRWQDLIGELVTTAAKTSSEPERELGRVRLK